MKRKGLLTDDYMLTKEQALLRFLDQGLASGTNASDLKRWLDELYGDAQVAHFDEVFSIHLNNSNAIALPVGNKNSDEKLLVKGGLIHRLPPLYSRDAFLMSVGDQLLICFPTQTAKLMKLKKVKT